MGCPDADSAHPLPQLFSLADLADEPQRGTSETQGQAWLCSLKALSVESGQPGVNCIWL